MSQPYTMDQNMMNGIPSNMKPMDPQGKSPLSNPYQFNGLGGSSHSSRNSSPGLIRNTTSQVPLPPMSIPASQLPPSRPQTTSIRPQPTTIHQLVDNVGNMNLSGATRDITPFTSPSVQRFTTSTPLVEGVTTDSNVQKFSANSAFPNTTQVQGFNHSTNSQFSTPLSRQNQQSAPTKPQDSNNPSALDNKEIQNSGMPKPYSNANSAEQKQPGANGPHTSQRTSTPVEAATPEPKNIPDGHNIQSHFMQTKPEASKDNFLQMGSSSSLPNMQQVYSPPTGHNNLTQHIPLNPQAPSQNQQAHNQQIFNNQNKPPQTLLTNKPNPEMTPPAGQGFTQQKQQSSMQSIASHPNMNFNQNIMQPQATKPTSGGLFQSQSFPNFQQNTASHQQNLVSHQQNIISSQQNILSTQQNIVSSQHKTIPPQQNTYQQNNPNLMQQNAFPPQQNMFSHQNQPPMPNQMRPQTSSNTMPPNVAQSQPRFPPISSQNQIPANQPGFNEIRPPTSQSMPPAGHNLFQRMPTPPNSSRPHQQFTTEPKTAQSNLMRPPMSQANPSQLTMPPQMNSRPPMYSQQSNSMLHGNSMPTQGNAMSPHGNTMSPQVNTMPQPPPGTNMLQQGNLMSPQASMMTPQGNVMPPHMNTMLPQNKLPPPPPIGGTPMNVPKPSPVNSGLPPPPPTQDKSSLHSNRYPQQQQQQQQQSHLNNQNAPQNMYTNVQYQNQNYQHSEYGQNNSIQNIYNQSYSQSQGGVTQGGFNRLWGHENVDLLQCPNVLPPLKVDAPKINLGQEHLDQANCSPDIFRCTMTKIPETASLLQKSRLPLGVLIHPFKDLNHLPVIQCNTIVRCRACRTYINPFVFFVDSKRWKCNLCYRVNELPEEFLFDPVSKTYGDPSRRPEIKSSTIEYIAPAEYMLRPPQPAIYLFLLDISRAAVESGYLHTVCTTLLAELSNLPGDTRMHIGFLAYDSALHFFNLGEGLSQPHELTVLEIDDVFLPCPDNLLVNLKDRMELVQDLLVQLPTRYMNTFDTGSALGSALQVAHKMMAATGGRVTVFQVSLPTIGPGCLTAREDPSQRASSEVQHLNPANDFYKRLALDCSGQQIAVDLFILNSMYIDLATVSGISRFSGGCIHHIPLYKAERTWQSNSLERLFKRYLTRKIGFEAVMRIRCTRGLAIHTFHGNFFVRSTDLLSLPNINPDAGFGMQVSIEESLADVQSICFQAALLYTSSKGERRIRVHTLCLPVANTLTDIINSADQQCIIGLLSKMAVDRSMQSSLADAREAFLNVAIDIMSSYKLSLNMGSGTSSLLAPNCLKLLPLYISALLKHTAFRTGTSTRLDDRVKAMCDMKAKPLFYIIQQIYPDLYPIHNLEEQPTVTNDEEEIVHLPPLLQLSSRNMDANGAYLMDLGEHMIILVCPSVNTVFLNEALGFDSYSSIPDKVYELPYLENLHNQRLHSFLNYLNDEKPFVTTMQVMRDDSLDRHTFFEKLIEDRVENALSYHEFLQHLKTQVK